MNNATANSTRLAIYNILEYIIIAAFYLFFLFGLAGNHPFSTLFFWANTSPMLQKDENATTPRIIESVRSTTSSEAMPAKIPSSRKSHQLLTPI